MTCYLAIDIGASSGRHILGRLDGGKLRLEEVYRFENRMIPQGGNLVWDVEHLFREILAGLRACAARGTVPATVAIDTWGVDYVLIDENEREILPVHAYRDERTTGPDLADFPFSPEELFRSTGTQNQPFNTIYQLWCDKKSGKLDRARRLLLMPSYLSWRLTGVAANEYTVTTTTGLIRARTRDWDKDLLRALGYDESLFPPPREPATPLGRFTDAVKAEVGFDALVLFAPSHDTAAAVAACPLDGETAFLSSGTWSLIGTENEAPILTPEAQRANFANEGSLEGRFRFLKNIPGMWLFQNIRNDLGRRYSYDEMMVLAEGSGFDRTIDLNDPRFLVPANMLEEVRAMLDAPTLPPADVLKSVYLSLAASYDRTIREIERVGGKPIRSLFIVGGGSRDRYLNRLTARVTGKRVFTGLEEATATGNIAGQIMYDKGVGLEDARALIRNSFEIRETTI